MESIWGKSAPRIDAPALLGRLAGYDEVLIDIGTGDGRFVQHMAAANPSRFAIGVDACRENLRAISRCRSPNALFLIASAPALPAELDRLATHITINFPWGSLLAGLLVEDTALADRLATIARPGALLELRMNGGALANAGWSLEDGGERARQVLRAAGFGVRPPIALGPRELRACPTSWAKRLACGRDPRALSMRGVYRG